MAAALLTLAAVAGADEVTRADLARAYLRFERAYAARPPEDPGPLNRRLDGIVGPYVGGRWGAVLRTLDGLTAKVTGTAPPGVAVRVRPRVHVAGAKEPPRLALAALRPEKRAWTLRVRDARGEVVFERPARWPATFALPRLTPGVYPCELVHGETAFAVARVYVVARPLAETRAAHAARLKRIEGPAQALATCRARNALLVDEPADARTVHYLVDPPVLARAVAAEIEALAQGRDPYRRRLGETWRVCRVGGMDVPLRVYAPKQVAADEPLPLVVALHGAGGDENLFFHGYGAGVLKDLADAHGFVAVSPLTYPIAASDAHFDAVVALAAACYPIDRRRVYVVGHSLGGMTASGLAVRRKERLAAVACIAGGGALGDTAPLLLVAGEHDRMFPPRRMAPGAAAARKRGLPVEFRAAKRLGHQLIVGAVLPDVVAWLMKHEAAR